MKKFVKRIPVLYHLLKSIRDRFRAFRVGRMVKKLEKSSSPLRIVIGAWGVFDEGWVPTDIEFLDATKRKDWERFFQKGSIDAVLSEHVWEHLTPSEASVAAGLCYDYLKPGGYFRMAVPDGFNPNPKYVEAVKPGGIGPGASDHKVLYNYKTLCSLLAQSGFSVNLLEYYDEKGVFHDCDWSPEQGTIFRSKKVGAGKQGTVNGVTYTGDGIIYTSLIVDAYKR